MLHFIAQAQPVNLSVKPNVSDSAHVRLNSYTLKVSPAGSQSLLRYIQVVDTGNYRFTLVLDKPCLLQFSIEKNGYKTFIVNKFISAGDSLLTLNCNLLSQNDSLPNVTVSLPTWKRGDTTFYNVEKYKTGSETKLKDVLARIPDFDLKSDGRLFYKNKPIEKITIDGEEVFSDKISLLVNSFPSHVLDQLQVLENQSENKLLKGLANDNKVFLNLSLKKNIKAVFGDGEIGIGSEGRYRLSPVLITVVGKLKGGFIGNYNSTGEGLENNASSNDYKVNPIYANRGWFLNSVGLQGGGVINSRNYIKNRLFDSRAQFSYPVSKSLKIIQEFTNVTDKQQQQTSNSASQLTGSHFTHQTDTTYYTAQPNLLVSQTKAEWSPKANAKLEVLVNYTGNTDQSNQISYYRFNRTTNDTLLSRLANKWTSTFVSLKYMVRKSERMALSYWASAKWMNLPKSGFAKAATIPASFGIGLPQYSSECLDISFATRQLMAGAQIWLKRKNKLYNIWLQAEINDVDWKSDLQFKDVSMVYPILPLSRYNGATVQRQRQISIGTVQRYRLKYLNLVIKPAIGIKDISVTENQSTWKKGFGVLKIQSSAEYTSGRRLRLSFGVDHETQSRAASETSATLKPTSLQSFDMHRGFNIPAHTTSLNASLFLSLSKMWTNSTSVFCQRNWNGMASSRVVNLLGVYTMDSFNRQPTDWMTISNNILWRRFSKQLQINLIPEFSINTRQYIVAHAIEYGHFTRYGVRIGIEKKWSNKLIVTNSNSIGINKATYPIGFLIDTAKNRVIDYRSSLQVEYRASARLHAHAGVMYNRNALTTGRSRNITLVNADCKYRIGTKRPIFLLFYINNVLNVKEYISSSLDAFKQSTNTLRLIGRTIMLTARYEIM